MITVFDESDLLAANPMFSSVPPAKLRQLVFASDRYEFADGEEIIRQGDPGAAGFLLLEGSAVGHIRMDDESRELGTVGPGFVVGDHAMIIGGSYVATAISKGKTKVLRIPREALLQVLEGDEQTLPAMMQALAERKAAAESKLGIRFDERLIGEGARRP